MRDPDRIERYFRSSDFGLRQPAFPDLSSDRLRMSSLTVARQRGISPASHLVSNDEAARIKVEKEQNRYAENLTR